MGEKVKMSHQAVHEEYVGKIVEIGRRLGYETKGVKTPIGQLDASWYDGRLSSYIEEMESLPVVVFEVVCSEDQKSLRGSLLNMISAKPSLAVFVLVKSEIRKKGGEKWLKRIENYVEKLKNEFRGIIRIDIWDEDKVNKLYGEISRK
ncbi:MAG: hypothetical protein ACTSYM_10040 [Candidatus Baldrarchaeia archaeon]